MSEDKKPPTRKTLPFVIRCRYDDLVRISELNLNPRNPNRHDDEQLKTYSEILKYQGVRRPVIVSKRSGLVTCGHGQIEASKRNGWTQVPVNYQEYDSEESEFAHMVADNALARQADLDFAAINVVVPDLGPDFDINMLGIKDFEIDVSEKVGNTDPDDLPALPKTAKTKRGEIYDLGGHRLMCGDSTDESQISKLMRGETADMVFTSPPYNAGKPVRTDGKDESFYEEYEDDKSRSEYLDLLKNFTSTCAKFSRYQFINIQMLAGNKIAVLEYLNYFRSHLCDMAIWDKGHGAPAMPRKVMNSRFEFVVILSSENEPNRAIQICDFRGTVDNVYDAPRGERNEFADVHGATFPVHLPSHWIGITKAKSVLDPFGGTGTTMIACHNLGRQCFMMEMDPIYCDLIIDRWQRYSGQTAVLFQS